MIHYLYDIHDDNVSEQNLTVFYCWKFREVCAEAFCDNIMGADINKRKKSKIIAGLLIVFLVYFGYTFFDQQNNFEAKASRMKSLEAKILEEGNLNNDLLLQKEMLLNDEYVEQIAREKLGMVKKGEKVYIDVGKEKN
jgi:cell division protein FtsB